MAQQISRNNRSSHNQTDFNNNSGVNKNKQGRKSPTPPTNNSGVAHDEIIPIPTIGTKKQRSASCFQTDLVNKENSQNRKTFYAPQATAFLGQTQVLYPQTRKKIQEIRGKSRNNSGATYIKEGKTVVLGSTASKIIDMKTYTQNLIYQQIGNNLKKKQGTISIVFIFLKKPVSSSQNLKENTKIKNFWQQKKELKTLKFTPIYLDKKWKSLNDLMIHCNQKIRDLIKCAKFTNRERNTKYITTLEIL